MKKLALAVLLLAAHSVAPAQTLRPALTLDTAARMRDSCLAWATDRKLSVAVAVYDESGRLLTFARMDGVSTAVGDIAMWKGKSAAIYRSASADTAKWNNPSFPGIATAGGGTAVFTQDGQPLGGIGVSGAATEEDIACGEAAIRGVSLKANGR
jgi:uncharacterized protein GlcG (DUF336 family)